MEGTNKDIKITFLGTGTSVGIPMITSNHPVCLSEDPRDKRLRSSILISWDSFNFVVDCGPDFRQQMLREQVPSLHGVFFTHEHSDHTAGFDDIRPFCFQIGEMPIYSDATVLKSLQQRFAYIFATENRYASAPKVKHFLLKNTFHLHGVQITPITVMHGSLPITGYRFGHIAYLTDVKYIEESEKKKLLGLDILIVNSLRMEPHYSHLNLEEALQLINELKPKKAYLTHISHLLGFHKKVEQNLPENVFLAYDGLKI